MGMSINISQGECTVTAFIIRHTKIGPGKGPNQDSSSCLSYRTRQQHRINAVLVWLSRVCYQSITALFVKCDWFGNLCPIFP